MSIRNRIISKLQEASKKSPITFYSGKYPGAKIKKTNKKAPAVILYPGSGRKTQNH